MAASFYYFLLLAYKTQEGHWSERKESVARVKSESCSRFEREGKKKQAKLYRGSCAAWSSTGKSAAAAHCLDAGLRFFSLFARSLRFCRSPGSCCRRILRSFAGPVPPARRSRSSFRLRPRTSRRTSWSSVVPAGDAHPRRHAG